ncbi:hypothetical protein AJ79_07680 [Helicocarpus griseus UAMH5409]|uniref:FAD/NAD(P)-binding domain-containing protein n=1 Tax=Helicocarpus griseus UAMH5409 TaxID=1447875 RepID=A0A2B7X0B3_9EURO|nr:hypothetical protein AJ79_07680 [Helicocarpus griseus UAMH5409]
MAPAKRIAIIGAGPAGAITVDAFAQEKAFDVIRVFERREKPGGCWVEDEEPPKELSDFERLANRTADEPIAAPESLPAYTPKSSRHRFADTSVYPNLESNIDASVMSFSQEPIPDIKSENSIKVHGPDTPFRHHSVVRQYIEDLLNRNGYQDLIEYNTTVENVEKLKRSNEWKLTLRRSRPGGKYDYWWVEYFDAVVVANGHYTVPFVPYIDGLAEFAQRYPRRVEHTKSFKGVEKYRGKRVIVVGASVSAADICVSLIDVAETPVVASVRGRYNAFFGDIAFRHPQIKRRPPISRISSSSGERTVYFEDGTSVPNVDHIIFGTGYTWSLPFLPGIPTRHNRVPDIYLHVFHQRDPTLAFVGANAAGFTFKVFEWQAVLAARVLAGRAQLPPLNVQKKWEADRIAYKGDGVPFTALAPDFEEYFNTVRELAGEPKEGQPGRRLPKFDPEWVKTFRAGHQKRIDMWERANKAAAARLGKAKL